MQRAFTQPTDRSIAFAGLEKRLASEFRAEAHFGIISTFLHRNLLWLRSEHGSLTRTCPGRGGTQKETAPSWSWAGYEGCIDFLEVEFEQVYWSEMVRFQARNKLECRVRHFRGCEIIHEGDGFVLVDE